MEVLKATEAFKKTDGRIKFSYVKYFVQQNGALFYGKWRDRFQAPKALEQLEDIQQIQTRDSGPEVRSSWSLVYIKEPSFLSYADGSDLKERLSREVVVCEILKENPHPNIASYHGCQTIRDRVSGLCFKRYMTTLSDKVNPQHLSKDRFRSSERQYVNNRLKASLPRILDGIRHLHSLGFVHNDINPTNIMYDESDNPVIIDFDSCRRIGENLRDTETKRTHQWHDPQVEIALEKNDLEAFDEMKTWLLGSTDDVFLFE